MLFTSLAQAKKTNQTVIETPFDLAAGGASLTMAAKEGRLFANPALLPHGGKFHQWAGISTTVLTSRDSIDMVRNLSSSGGGNESSEGTGGSEQFDQYVEQATKAPIHVGAITTLSWLTKNFAFSIFDRIEPDLKIERFGDSGLPEARFSAESYHGVAVGSALRTPWRWLSFGLAFKTMMIAEPEIVVAALDEQTLSNLQEPSFLAENTSHNRGTGVDFGMLWFFQGKNLDLKLASKVDDLGSTQLSGAGPTTHFKQVVSSGIGVTLHSTADALHLALDYRDVTNSYPDPLYKKVYAGVRATLRTYLGLATGIYHGHPTFGMELDLVLARISVSYYTREMGDSPGVDRRNMMMASFSMGY
jgi:hypothetical protein